MQASIACVLGLVTDVKAICIYGETVTPSDLSLLVELEISEQVEVDVCWHVSFYALPLLHIIQTYRYCENDD